MKDTIKDGIIAILVLVLIVIYTRGYKCQEKILETTQSENQSLKTVNNESQNINNRKKARAIIPVNDKLEWLRAHAIKTDNH